MTHWTLRLQTLWWFQALSATLLYYNRKYGMRASGVLFFFWFFLILAGLPQLRSEIMMHYELAEDENVQYNFVSYMIYYPLIILMFILNCFADLPPKESPYKYNKVSTIIDLKCLFSRELCVIVIEMSSSIRINVQRVPQGFPVGWPSVGSIP